MAGRDRPLDDVRVPTTQSPRWGRPDTVAILAVLMLFLCSRWIWLHDLPPSASYWEESYRWIAMQQLIDGPTRPLADYQADHYQGGSLVAILLARVIATLTGTGLVTLKIAALVFSSGTLVILYLIGRRFFGRMAGLVAASIYICGPPLVAYWGVCLMGFHSESIMLSLLLVYATLALATGLWGGVVAWAFAGAIATFSLWFTPTAGIAVAACGLGWFVLRGLPRRSDLVAGGAGAAVGLSPWILYNATRDWVGIDRIVEVFSTQQSNDVFRTQNLWERAVDLVVRVPTEGLLDPGGDLVGSIWRPVLFVGVLVPASLGLMAGLRRLLGFKSGAARPASDAVRLELVFWIYEALFAVVYLASRFTLDIEQRPITFRLHVPPAVFMILPLAISAANGLRAGGTRRIVSGVAAGFFLVSLASTTAVMATRHEAEGSPLSRDLGYVVLGRLAQRKYAKPLERSLEEVSWIPDADDRAKAQFGIGWGISEYYVQMGSLDELRTFIDRNPPDHALLRGMLWGVRNRLLILRSAAEGDDSPDFEQWILRMRTIRRALQRRIDSSESLESASPTGRVLDPDRSTHIPVMR